MCRFNTPIHTFKKLWTQWIGFIHNMTIRAIAILINPIVTYKTAFPI